MPQGREKLRSIMSGLAAMTGQKQKEQEELKEVIPESISDDFMVSEEVRLQIEREEMLVREALAVFGISYDDLIKMDGQSVYSRAVAANPKVLDMVAKADRPVIAALHIATQFKPYAEFMNKYGTEPEAIKEAIRQEIQGEAKGAQVEKEKTEELKNLPFASPYGRTARVQREEKPQSLKEVFQGR